MVQWHNSIKIQLVADSINYCVIGAVLLIVSHYSSNGIFHIFSHLYGQRFGYVGGRPTYWIRIFCVFRIEKRVIEKICNSRNIREKKTVKKKKKKKADINVVLVILACSIFFCPYLLYCWVLIRLTRAALYPHHSIAYTTHHTQSFIRFT